MVNSFLSNGRITAENEAVNNGGVGEPYWIGRRNKHRRLVYLEWPATITCLKQVHNFMFEK